MQKSNVSKIKMKILSYNFLITSSYFLNIYALLFSDIECKLKNVKENRP